MVSALLLRVWWLVPLGGILSVKKFLPQIKNWFFLELRMHKHIQKSKSVQLKNLVLQVGRVLRSLLQRFPQSRVRCWIRPGVSGLYSIRSWKHPKMKRACTATLDDLLNLTVFRGKNSFPFIQSELFLFQFMHIVSCSPATSHCEDHGSVLSVRSYSSSNNKEVLQNYL